MISPLGSVSVLLQSHKGAHGHEGQVLLPHLGASPGGTGSSSVSPSEPHPKDGPHPQLHLPIRDLDDAHLRRILEELQMETARREGIAPLIGSPLGQWQDPMGGVDADMDDGEVTLQ